MENIQAVQKAVQNKISEAKQAIEKALFAGRDTQDLRTTLAELEKDLSKAEQEVAKAAQALHQAEAERADQLAAEAVADAHQTLLAAAGADVVAGVQMPAPDVDPVIEAAAARLAAARDRLAQDQAVYQEHRSKASALQGRLTEKSKTRDEILARRNAGDERPGDGGEILLLAADVDNLRTLAATANAAAEAHLPTVAQRLVAEAENALAAARSRAVFNAKVARLDELQRAFLAAHAEVCEAGFAVGLRNKHTVWRCSPELRAITYGA